LKKPNSAILIQQKAYKKANAAWIKPRDAEWFKTKYYPANKTALIAKTVEWRKNNMDKVIANRKKHYQKNKSYYKHQAMKREAAKLQRTPAWLTEQHWLDIKEQYIIADELRWLSEEPLEVDHIIPLQGKLVSGLHVPWNLQILPRSTNRRKNNRYE
jgi:hypothetical protein